MDDGKTQLGRLRDATGGPVTERPKKVCNPF
jgi:hypothetical protein